MVAYVTFNNVSFSISDYFKLIVQLWTCRNKHIILSWAFMTNNIVNCELKMSTAKSLCYMAPPALVSKCQPRKKWWKTSVRPTLITTLHPTIFNRFYSYQLQLLLIFWDLAAQEFFWIHTDQCGGLLSLPLYSPQYSRDRIDILHSHYPEWEHEPFWLGRLYFHFLGSFGISKFYEYTLTDVLVWIRFCPTPTIFRISFSFLSQLLALVRTRIVLITVSFVKISSWETMHFP